MSWVRLWADMPTDPKWRVIARKSGRPIAEVIAVFTMMLTNAGANACERGVLDGWSDEDVSAALDIETAAVTSIRDAMQGKTLDGNNLTGWEKRQPKREDGSAERAKQWRERKRTQANAQERPDADSEADSDSEKKEDSYQPARTEQAAASGPVEIDGLNGSTRMIVETMAGWLSPYAPDFERAHRTIADAVQIYGSQAVRDGFADLKADHADGKVRAMSVKAFYGFVKHARDGKQPGRSPQNQTASERRAERTRKLLAEVDAELAATAGVPN